MHNEPIVGIDPVDFKSLDSSRIYWDKQNETWIVGNGNTAHCHLYGQPVSVLPSTGNVSWNSPSDLGKGKQRSKYQSELDLEFNRSEFCAYMYILGFSDDDISVLKIDEIVDKVRNIYKYKHGQPSDTASQTFIKRKNIALLRGIRRSHHRVQVITDGN
jgi:hypothetical protein